MSLFVVLRYLCTHNSSFPLFGDLFLGSNDSFAFDNNSFLPFDTNTLTESCNEVTYEFEFDFTDDYNTASNESWTPPFSICQPFTPDDPLLACATGTSPNDQEECSTCTPCDPGTYGSSLENCSECTPGFHNPDPGGTACFACDPGGFSVSNGTVECENCSAGTYNSVPGSTACDECTKGSNYSSVHASTTCTQCTAECPEGREFWAACTAASDTNCVRCPPVANCIYTETGPCGNSSAPNCVAGFELVDGQCEECQPGFYKNQTDPYPCIPWDTTDCPFAHYAINGTRFHNSACLPCPEGPENATFIGNSTSCEWSCDAGFNNTLEY